MNGWENHRVEATLSIFSRGREVDTASSLETPQPRKNATRLRVSRPQQSTPRRRHRRRRRCRLENGCTYVAGRARKDGWKEGRERIFLWRLEGNSPCPEENSSSFLAAFHIPYFFHRFFPPPPFRCVKPLRALYPMSTRFSFLFSSLSSSSPRLLRRISCAFSAGFPFAFDSKSSIGGISGESSRFERLAD